MTDSRSFNELNHFYLIDIYKFNFCFHIYLPNQDYFFLSQNYVDMITELLIFKSSFIRERIFQLANSNE